MVLAAVEVSENSIPDGLALIALAVTLGLALGAVRFRGMRLGISGVLFSALLFGQLGFSVPLPILQFLRDFALIIFIYSLGLQVGPGFISSLRAEGLRLNGLSVLVLLLGTVLSAAMVRIATLPKGAAPGIYAGAFTTTPGFAAGQEALREKWKASPSVGSIVGNSALAYSVGYPFGVVGPILVIVMLKRLFRVDIDRERRELATAEQTRRPRIETADFEVTEVSHANAALRDHPLVRKHAVVFSRLLRDGILSVPTGDTEIRIGDIYRAVGTRIALSDLVSAMGRPVVVDFGSAHGDVERQELVVTRTKVLRKTLRELDLIRRYGVTVARINRAGIDLVPKASLRIMFADRLTVVGAVAAIRDVETELGNSPETLNRPQLIPIFFGIVLGVLVGTAPIFLPGLNITLRIGLAGGPLIAAIILSQLGNLGSLVWYMPVAASALFKDFGLAVFLACVGLEAGNKLIQRVTYGGGLRFVLCAAAVTVLPVFLVACLARVILRMNFFTLSGWIAGAMTSTTSLAFANDLAESDAPAVSYAAVAPLATLVPIVCAQLLAIWK